MNDGIKHTIDKSPDGTRIQLDYLHNILNGDCNVSAAKITGTVIGSTPEPNGVLFVDWDNGAHFVLDINQDKWHEFTCDKEE